MMVKITIKKSNNIEKKIIINTIFILIENTNKNSKN